MEKFRAAVGFDCGMDQMVTEQSKTFDTRQEAEDWVDFQMNMDYGQLLPGCRVRQLSKKHKHRLR